MEQRIRLGDRLRRERRDRGRLGQHGRADGEVSRQAVHRALQLPRYQQPAQPPSGHREVFRKAVHHNGFPRCLPCAAGVGGALVHQAVIDLVADQPNTRLRAPRRDRRQLVGWDHGAGRIGRARHDHALHGRIELREHLRGRLEPGLGSARDLDDLTAERRQDVAVTRISGARDRDAVTDVEAGQERQQEIRPTSRW